MFICDQIIVTFWNSFIAYEWSQWPLLEAYLATFSFFLFISLFRVMDQFPFFLKYRFQKTPTPELKALNLLSFETGVIPGIIYLLAIHLYHMFVLKSPLDLIAPSFIRVFIETIAGIVIYDFLFFWIHLFMHYTPKLQFLHQHHIHHSQTRLLASEVQHHSFIDATLQIVVNILVQNTPLPYFGRKHSLSRLLHNIIITYLLTEIHAGYDAWWSLHNLFPSIIGGAKRHEVHHQNGAMYFQQFFMYLDDLFLLSNNTKQIAIKQK